MRVVTGDEIERVAGPDGKIREGRLPADGGRDQGRACADAIQSGKYFVSHSLQR